MALTSTRQLRSQGPAPVQAHRTGGVTGSEGWEEANGVGGGIGVGGGNGDGNGVEGGNRQHVNGQGDEDGVGTGTGTGVEVNEATQDGNGDGSGNGAGTGTGTSRSTIRGGAGLSQICPRLGRGRHENSPSQGLIRPTLW